MRNEMTAPVSHSVTKLLLAWRQGDEAALAQLVPLVYQRLRRLARHYMAGQRPDHTLQATALVNEAYMRLVDCQQVNWKDRAHFFAISAQMMRRVLVEFARSAQYQKRGGGAQKISLDEELTMSPPRAREVLALDDALQSFAGGYQRQSQVVELRFFGGLSIEETAEVLQMSAITVRRDWRFAKAWLARELDRREENSSRTPAEN
jgi:RNA polymerase sigma factor (TIGR02999 family)